MTSKSKPKVLSQTDIERRSFVSEQFKSDVEKTALMEAASNLFDKMTEVFGSTKAQEIWFKIPAPKAGGRPPGPTDPEITRQLLMFYKHWRLKFPDLKIGEIRRNCARMLHLERKGEFGNSEDAIFKKLQRLDKKPATKNSKSFRPTKTH